MRRIAPAKRTCSEEPGRIPHELRYGEMANLHEVPQAPSDASVDSTLLFLTPIDRHATWAGSLDLFRELRPNIEGPLAGAQQFRYGRLPEFIVGTQRKEDSPPIHTPRTDPLQAWSAGAVPYMVTGRLGLHANGFDKRLRVVRPILPVGIVQVELRDIRVAGATASLRFQRRSEGAIEGEVAGTQGEVDVVFEA